MNITTILIIIFLLIGESYGYKSETDVPVEVVKPIDHELAHDTEASADNLEKINHDIDELEWEISNKCFERDGCTLTALHARLNALHRSVDRRVQVHQWQKKFNIRSNAYNDRRIRDRGIASRIGSIPHAKHRFAASPVVPRPLLWF